MRYDKDKVDEAVLALLYLTSFGQGKVLRAWKSHDWEALNRLHAKALISDTRTTAKSVLLSEDGMMRAERLFAELFGADSSSDTSDDA